MKIKKILPTLYVSDQISVTDLGVAAAQGIKAVINNRPDGEAARIVWITLKPGPTAAKGTISPPR